MHSFADFSARFEERFQLRQFPEHTRSLYDPAQYILGIGGKRIRPVCVYLANELFGEVTEDAFNAAASIELFHNFSLIHDDIMDKAPTRRGKPTVHEKFGNNTALLAGDVMFVTAYEYLGKISAAYLPQSISVFNKTAKQVCEGQQLDMDFEQKSEVALDEYLQMITLKTSVLLAASFEMGAILGGAAAGSRQHLYEFGKNLGIAFQVQDDYLDAFGDAGKTGKQTGGDILAGKKTFLLIHALAKASPETRTSLLKLMSSGANDKVQQVLSIYKETGADQQAMFLKQKYFELALTHLEAVGVQEIRKSELRRLADTLMQREH